MSVVNRYTAVVSGAGTRKSLLDTYALHVLRTEHVPVERPYGPTVERRFVVHDGPLTETQQERLQELLAALLPYGLANRAYCSRTAVAWVLLGSASLEATVARIREDAARHGF